MTAAPRRAGSVARLGARSRKRIAIGAVILAVSHGCEGKGRQAATSAGVIQRGEVVLAMSIGEDESRGEEYLFGSIRTVMATPTGNVWVIDASDGTPLAQNPLVRLYDSTGAFLRIVGREGEGPGEYVFPYALAALRSGRVALRDYRLPGRITLYTSAGEADTTWNLGVRLQWPANGPHGVVVDSGGTIWLPFESRGRPAGPGRPAVSRAFLRVRSDGSVADTMAFPELPVVEDRVIRITKLLPGGGTSTRGIAVPYRPAATWSWSPVGGFGVARTDRYEITLTVFPPPDRPGSASPSGRSSVTMFRRNVLPIAVSEREREALERRLLADAEAAGGGSGDMLSVPAFKPLIRSFWFAEGGRLLVRVSTPSREVDGEWVQDFALDVFEPDGTYRGRIELPTSFTPEMMIGDRIWGVYRDAFDVESVRRYDVIWP